MGVVILIDGEADTDTDTDTDEDEDEITVEFGSFRLGRAGTGTMALQFKFSLFPNIVIVGLGRLEEGSGGIDDFFIAVIDEHCK